MMKNTPILLGLFCIISLIPSVSAYWDVGTGTLIWQAIAGFGLVIMYTIKIKWQFLKDRLFKK